MSHAPDVRSPAVAGQFYPKDPQALRRVLEELAPARVEPVEHLKGVLAPHAGYPYSGAIAALAHATLRASSDPEGILVMGPSHFVPFRGACVPRAKGYATPLGVVRYPEAVVARLESTTPLMVRSDIPHAREHSVEVQIPLIQHFFPDPPPVIPLVVGTLMHEDLDELADALIPLLDTWLVVVSSDLYHGYSVEEGERRDARTLQSIAEDDAHTFLERMLSGEVMACGGMPIALMKAMMERRGGGTFSLLAYTHSARVTGERGGYVVGYAAGVWRNGRASR